MMKSIRNGLAAAMVVCAVSGTQANIISYAVAQQELRLGNVPYTGMTGEGILEINHQRTDEGTGWARARGRSVVVWNALGSWFSAEQLHGTPFNYSLLYEFSTTETVPFNVCAWSHVRIDLVELLSDGRQRTVVHVPTQFWADCWYQVGELTPGTYRLSALANSSLGFHMWGSYDLDPPQTGSWDINIPSPGALTLLLPAMLLGCTRRVRA